MGPNRAKISVKAKPGKEYLFRNIASAFPDNGKNMLLKDRSLPRSSVTSALDHSPYHLRIYGNADHTKEDQSRFRILNKNYYSTPLNQREALILAQAPKKATTEENFYQIQTYGFDDAFEPNNTKEQAFDLSSFEDRWLGLIGSEGVQWDEDWFKIWVSPQYRRLVLDLRFQNYLGDIDFRLYDQKGNLVGASQGASDDEYLNLILDHGGYFYVQIYGSNRGNRYDLKYSTFFTGGGDDEYEKNDTLATAYDLRSSEGKWLSEIKGEGVAADDDYFKIQVKPGRTRIVADLRVDVDRGDVDIRLLNSAGKMLASSANITDDDYIDFDVKEAGTYYLKVYPFNPGVTYNMYDLKWFATEPVGARVSRARSSNSSSKQAALSGSAVR